MADLLHEITIKASPERVYEAIVNQQHLRRWWTPDSQAEPKADSVAVFGFFNHTVVFRMRIDELVAGRRVAWSCLGDRAEWGGTKLSFEVAAVADGATRLRFTHAGWIKTSGDFAPANTTWGALMVRLKDYVEGRNPGPFFTGRAD
jgi:uncharacterized protein YndB with AHSA1/START domain